MSARTLLILLLTLFASVPATADIIAQVDATRIDEMQTVRLTVRITGTNDADLDYAAVEADFELTGPPTTQSQFRSVNGRVTSWVEYQLTLRPKRTGRLTIPSLAYDGERTEPIQIQVQAVTQSVRDEIDQLVYFDVQLDKPKVYVQAQAVLTRRLYYTAGVQIYGNLPGAPELDDAVVLTLGEASSGTTLLDGVRYGVLEQRYAIFPEKSGQITIPGFHVTSSVRLADRGRRGVRVRAPEQTLEVLPVPAAYPDHLPWFPARRVILSERWTPDGRTFKPGDALQREIAVVASGAIGSAIPPYQAEIPESHFKQYPQAPEIEDDPTGAYVIGRRTQSYELIATHGGAVQIPEVSLTWWDTEADELRTSTLASRTLTLSGAPPSEDASPPEPQAPATPAAQPTSTPTAPRLPTAVWWVALFGLATALGVWMYTRRTPPAKPARKQRSPERALKQAQGSAGAVLDVLLEQLQRRGLTRAQALHALRAGSEDGSRLLTLIEGSYAPGAQHDPEIDELARRVLKSLTRHGRARIDPLPPLYPDQP